MSHTQCFVWKCFIYNSQQKTKWLNTSIQTSWMFLETVELHHFLAVSIVLNTKVIPLIIIEILLKLTYEKKISLI
jgi:hypothetical protein